MDSFTMPRVSLISVAGPDAIVHVLFSIPDQICCENLLVFLWVYLNTRYSCVVIQSLYWTSVLQGTATKHTSVFSVVLQIFPKTDLIDTFKESYRWMISYLLPSEWKWHCVYLIWTCPGFSIISMMKYFMRFQWYFLNIL